MFRRHVGFAVAAISLIATACGASSPSAPPSASPTASASATTVAVASPIPSPQASAGFRVVGLDVTADPANPTAACPIKIVFHSRITVDGGSGTVSFRWVSSDGDVSPVETKNFTGPGSYDRTTSWTVDEATVPSGAGWSSIEIVSPVGPGSLAASPHASFTFTCVHPQPVPTPTNGPVPEIQTIGFGTGGSGCDLTGIARTFSAGVTVYNVATFSPLPDSVTITVSKDAVVIYGPTTAKLDASVGCQTGRMPNLEVGHYKVVMTVVASEMPPLTGEFDVK